MNLSLKILKNSINTNFIVVSGSKSESNRLLILQKLYPNLIIENLSNSDDTKVLQKTLEKPLSIVDVHHAGTAMRFLTAYFALIESDAIILTGSQRMQERPIKILVTALQDLGAYIEYVNEDGYPPIRIKKATSIAKEKVTIQGNVSSQYISALLLVASKLKNGITIELIGTITSVPYIKMTLSLLNKIGIETTFYENTLRVLPKSNIDASTITIEPDWSSASYWYSLIALGDNNSKITLSAYRKNSLQGDSCLVGIYEQLGVKTTFYDTSIILEKTTTTVKHLTQNLKSAPDIAQTIAVTCFGLGISCDLTGLHTLKIKETDRLAALEQELTKLGAIISITDDSLHLKKSDVINENIAIKTYDDHRMAMAFAPLVLKVPISILNAEVVSKSYPNFWNDLEKVGVVLDKV